MRRLYLVGSEETRAGATPRRGASPPFDLERQPRRPGELCREVRLDIDQRPIAVGAAAAGVPISLWATVAVESRRCVDLTAALFGVSRGTVGAALEQAVTDERTDACERETVPGSRLRDYGEALVRAVPHRTQPAVGGVLLRPPLRMLSAWSLAADDADVELELWAASVLADPPDEPVQWQASAALSAQTLAEWALVQTARRLRSASTLAHTAV
jgi:hypothetical protein